MRIFAGLGPAKCQAVIIIGCLAKPITSRLLVKDAKPKYIFYYSWRVIGVTKLGRLFRLQRLLIT